MNLIEQMAESFINTTETQGRNAVIAWAQDTLELELRKNGEISTLSETLGNNAKTYVKLLNLNKLIVNTKNLVIDCIDYSIKPLP